MTPTNPTHTPPDCHAQNVIVWIAVAFVAVVVACLAMREWTSA